MIVDLESGSRIYGDAFIKLFTEKKNWTDARKHCQSLGGDLLSITSSDKNDYVKEVFLKQLSLPTYRNGKVNQKYISLYKIGYSK